MSKIYLYITIVTILINSLNSQQYIVSYKLKTKNLILIAESLYISKTMYKHVAIDTNKELYIKITNNKDSQISILKKNRKQIINFLIKNSTIYTDNNAKIVNYNDLHIDSKLLIRSTLLNVIRNKEWLKLTIQKRVE